MEQIPLVSIILPVYNSERYLREALDTLLAQTFTDWELILVDDPSKDATDAIIAEYVARDPRIHAIHNTGHKLPGALNTGFAAARGALLSWTQDDNRYHPDTLAILTDRFAVHPEVDFVYSDFAIIDGTDALLEQYVVAEPNDLPLEKHSVACFMYRRAVYERVGDYAEDLFLAEDYDYYLRVLASGCTMAALHQNLYDYRLHDGSLTGSHKKDAFGVAERALLRFIGAQPAMTAQRRARIFIHLAALASWRGDRGASLRYASEALRADPQQVIVKGMNVVSKRLFHRRV